MKKKGFTLIELLAIIVILAIIAVVTVPIILGIVDEAKKKAAEDSAHGYKEAVNRLYASELMRNSDYSLDDKIYTVSELDTAGVSISGAVPEGNSWVNIVDDELVSACLQFGDYRVTISDGVVGNAEKGECQNYIISKYNLTLVTSGSGLYESTIEPGRLVYRGTDEDTDNFIILKEDEVDTVYRIMSFESDGTIKVIRDDSIGSYAWDETTNRNSEIDTYCSKSSSNGCNAWASGAGTYYEGENIADNFHYMYYYGDSGWQTFGSGIVTKASSLNIYLNGDWLDSTGLSPYIESHDFNVGGLYIGAYTDYGLDKEKESEKKYTWNGKVGLINVTEYVESSIHHHDLAEYSCKSVFDARRKYPSMCNQQNYNYKGDSQWFLSPYATGRDMVYFLSSQGDVTYGIVSLSNGIRPVLFLKSGTNLTGVGSSTNPYRVVGM